jgi:hypothetical protein
MPVIVPTEKMIMSDSDAQDGLQFETAVPHAAPSDAVTGEPGSVTCRACQRTITDEYFDINGQPVCDSCRVRIEEQAETPRGWGVFARTGLYGLGATIAGAVLYYAVIAITDFEIGIVAIAIGYMVGYAVRAGARGRGGRRFQVLALALTYWAVGLAYTPVAFSGTSEQSEGQTQTTPASPTSDSTDEADAAEEVNIPLGIAFLLVFSLALPVLVVAGSMPGGLISAAIIAFGMHQAWRMTAALQVQITGPYRIASSSVAGV